VLKKAGLGSLFGIVTNNVGNWKNYMTNSLLFVSEHQTRFGETTNVPSSTSAVALVKREVSTLNSAAVGADTGKNCLNAEKPAFFSTL
jgi:hypothetical protein